MREVYLKLSYRSPATRELRRRSGSCGPNSTTLRGLKSSQSAKRAFSVTAEARDLPLDTSCDEMRAPGWLHRVTGRRIDACTTSEAFGTGLATDAAFR